MELTTEQIEAIRGGDVVHVVPPEIGAECVVVKADQFLRMKALLQNCNVLTTEEQRIAIQEAGKVAGWEDDSMDVYERYRDPQ